MDKQLRANLVFHGAIVILLGMLAGFPYAFVVMGSMEGEIRAWRMAHLEGVLNGLLCIGAGGVLGGLALAAGQRRLMAWSFIVMAYCNVLASILGAWTGQRGLEPAMPITNFVVFSLFTIAIVGVFVGLGLLAYGARPGASGRGGDVTVEVKAGSSQSPSRPRSSIPGGVDVEVSVNRPGSAPPAPEPDDEPEGGGDAQMSRAERRRAKKSR